MIIKILDNTLTYKGEVDNFESFIPRLLHGGMSAASLQIRADKNNAEYLIKGNYIYTDIDHPFIITEVPKEYNEDGATLNIVAYDIFWILAGRLSNTTDTPIEYTGQTVEYVIKDLIDKALVSATDTDRTVSIIEIAANQDRGSTINVKVNQTPLDEDIKQLLAIDYLGLKASLDLVNKKLIIDIYEGADRSVGNLESNAPVQFSVDYDNIKSGEEKDSNANVKNFAYVLGQGAGARVIEEYGTATGIARREITVDAGDTTDTTEMDAIGAANLTEEEKGLSVDVDALDGSFVFGVDFFIGDIVTVQGNALRVSEAISAYEEGRKDNINITFGQRTKTPESELQSTAARVGKLEVKTGMIGDWKSSSGWTYSSVDDPIGVVTVPSGAADIYSPGMRIKFDNGGHTINGIIQVVTDTSITYLHEIDTTDSQALYLMADSAITNIYYSAAKAPHGFPLEPRKWTVYYISTTAGQKDNPASGTWYYADLGSHNFYVPLGEWKDLKFQCKTRGVASSAASFEMECGMSTNSSTPSDRTYIAAFEYYTLTRFAVTIYSSACCISQAAKTQWFFIARLIGSNLTVLRLANNDVTLTMSATCAYL